MEVINEVTEVGKLRGQRAKKKYKIHFESGNFN